MSHLFLTWMFWNAVAGGVIVTAGVLWAARHTSPVRRLRIIEWTLVASLLAPVLATMQFPWQWTLEWLPPKQPAITQAASTATRPTATMDQPGPHELPRPADIDVNHQRPLSSSSAMSPQSGKSSFTAGSVLIACQLVAMAAVVAWWLLSVLTLWRIWRRSIPADARIALLLSQVQSNSSCRVDIRISPDIPTACAFGMRRWCILLPEAMVKNGDADQIRFALAHEWSHLVNRDLGTWRLTRIAQLTLWFQPAYWWLRHQVRLCQDFLADADAAETGCAPDFAAFLLKCARHGVSLPLSPALPLSSRSSDLTRRITMLLTNSAPLERRCPRRLQALALSLVVATLTVAAFVRVDAQDTPAANQPPVTQADPQQAQDDERTGEDLTYHCRVITYGTEQPIAGATIRVKRSLYGDPRYKRHHPLETTTHTSDADGNYTVVIPAEQTRERYLYIELDVEHPLHMAKRGFGYSMAMTRKNEKLGERPFFETTKLRAAELVTGRLVTPTGEPAGHVKLTGYQFPGESSWLEGEGNVGSFFEAQTDADGRFSVPVVTPGKAALWFQPDDAAPLGVVAPEQRGDVGEITLTKGFRVKGRVLDADGKPIVGVHVNAQRQSSESPGIDSFNQRSAAVGGYGRGAKTDEQGEFELLPVDEGNYEFRIAEYEKSNGPANFSGIFVHQSISLTEEQKPLEFRALPTVTITVRNVDAAGEPRRGFDFTVWGTPAEGGWFAGHSNRPPDGVCVAEIPRGLKDVKLNLIDNEHGSYRVRRSPDAEWESTSQVELGTIDADVTGIVVVRYKAPVLLIKAVDLEGNIIDDIKVTALLNFEKQQDGRWRSRQMLPDKAITVTVTSSGKQAASQEVTLAEGETRELVFKMMPE